jgi:hypothetical protein
MNVTQDFEEGGRGLFEGTAAVFACKDWVVN